MALCFLVHGPPGAKSTQRPGIYKFVEARSQLKRPAVAWLLWRRRLFASAGGVAAAGSFRRRARRRSLRRSSENNPLGSVPEAAWPLLQRAEELDPSTGWQEIAAGLEGWRRALERGRVWEEADGANWPEAALREEWSSTLEDLELPRFTKRYPELIDPLLHRLLEIVVQFTEALAPSASPEPSHAQQPSEGADAQQPSEGADGSAGPQQPQQQQQQQQPPNAAQDQGRGDTDAMQGKGEAASSELERKDLTEGLMQEFREDWESAADAFAEAEQAFGPGGAEALATGFTSSGAPWRQSKGWEAASKLRSLLTRMPELQKLIRRLGRRAALRGPTRRLPAEVERLTGIPGVARSQRAPTEVAGLALSSALGLMIPAEALLLVRGRTQPCLRALHHARRIEASLMSYDRASWLETPAKELRSEEARPANENGPIIVCLDTSGSMVGAPEMWAKALVFECLRQAHRQARRCCLFAFSAGENLQQLELDLSSGGLERLLEFLQYAFHGGSSLDEVLLASVERLGSSKDWENADILLVTDGQVPEPDRSVVTALQTARQNCGAHVYGVVVGSKDTGEIMASICSELYRLSSRRVEQLEENLTAESLDPAAWSLRRLPVATSGARPVVAATRAPKAMAMAATRRMAKPQAACSARSGLTGMSGRGVRTLQSRTSVQLSASQEAQLQGEQRDKETEEERLRREARWRERAEAREREKEAAVEERLKGWEMLGGRLVRADVVREREAQIEQCLQEANLREAPLERHLLRAPLSTADAETEDPIAANWAKTYLASFGEDIFSVLALASQEAARLGHEFGRDAVLIGLLTFPAGAALCREGLSSSFGGRGDAVEAARLAMEAFVRSEKSMDDSFKQPGSDRSDLKVTPMLRQILEAVEAERLRLGNEEATLGHLLLVLTSDTFAGGALEAVLASAPGAKLQHLRVKALEGLQRSSFVAAAEGRAEAWLLARRAKVVASTPPMLLPGLFEAYSAITRGLTERSVEAKLLLLAALAGEHLFLVGAPGTAKSLLARRLSAVCSGFFFERLLTRFSVPEEIFGPLSLQALEQDELKRKTKGYLPEADVAFIDEIFKANSSILNSLLAILNERCFDNGAERMKVPLWCAVAASNELPDTDELDALYDRFLIRRCVPRISAAAVPSFLRQALDAEDATADVQSQRSSAVAASPPLISATTSAELQARARCVEFPDELLQIIADLRDYMWEQAEPPYAVSDRRLAKSVRLLRVAAAAVGAPAVVEADLLLLRHVFWDRDPKQGEAVSEWLLKRFGEASGGQKAWPFIFEGIKKRLSSDPYGPALAGVRRDLQNLREAAASAMDLQLRVAQDAPRPPTPTTTTTPTTPDSGATEDCRFFWLEADERLACASLGRKAAKRAAELASMLLEASVLLEVAEVEDGPTRCQLLAKLLGLPALAVKEETQPKRDLWGDLL
ncbi:unnamed protein product [Polarella glacialis]|uniref:VWFA domain-containing protein n=1 Tax=Polarella glacialis TaxID=89957 RepID=A0A813DQD4_POLGL|nr:unnamed protein product [Polarella glacialis]